MASVSYALVFRSVLYGGVGVQLASAFVSAVLPWDVLYGADGKILPSDNVIVNQSALEVQGPIKFLIQDLVKLSHVSESVANRTALAAMKQIAAIRQAHLVCICWVNKWCISWRDYNLPKEKLWIVVNVGLQIFARKKV